MYFCKLNFVIQLVRFEVKIVFFILVIMFRRLFLLFYFKFNFVLKNCVLNLFEVKMVFLIYCNLQFFFNKIFYEYYKDFSFFYFIMIRDRYYRLSLYFIFILIGYCFNFYYFCEIYILDICNILFGIENLIYSR